MDYREEIVISDELVNEFANLIGDKNPIHLDDEYAKDSIFGRRIAHGMLLASYFSKIIAQDFPGEGSIYLSQSIKFLKPCFVGDSVVYLIELLEKNDTKFLLKTEIYDKYKNLLVTGEALIINKSEKIIQCNE